LGAEDEVLGGERRAIVPFEAGPQAPGDLHAAVGEGDPVAVLETGQLLGEARHELARLVVHGQAGVEDQEMLEPIEGTRRPIVDDAALLGLLEALQCDLQRLRGAAWGSAGRGGTLRAGPAWPGAAAHQQPDAT